MAIPTNTTSQVAHATSSNGAVQHNNNPLEEKTVCANIRVTEIINDADAELKQDERSVPLVEQPIPSIQDVQHQEQAEEMRSWWNSEMKKHMSQPDGYSKVGVLLIKWADELDDLKTRSEVQAKNPCEIDFADDYRPRSWRPSSARNSSIILELPSLMYAASQRISSTVTSATSSAISMTPTIYSLYAILVMECSMMTRSIWCLRPQRIP